MNVFQSGNTSHSLANRNSAMVFDEVALLRRANVRGDLGSADGQIELCLSIIILPTNHFQLIELV
jgi:hypothetical protein